MNEYSQHTTPQAATVEDYLRGCCNGFPLPDETLANIAEDRFLLLDLLKCDLDKRTKDLLKADVYRQICLLPSVTSSVEDADGGWKHKEGGTQISEKDKKYLREEANRIYAMYGEDLIGKPSMKINSYGMKVWQRKC